jgi:DNA-binding GntR family transcriptional regulator
MTITNVDDRADADTSPPRALKRTGDSVDRIFEQLIDDIMSGRLQPEQKLTEEAISKRFSVSRGPVREALRRLEERDLVQREPNAGVRVTSFSLTDFLAMVQVREALEGMACRLAAQNMTNENIRELSDYLDDRYQADLRDAPAKESGEIKLDYRDIELEFHYRIARACGNPALSKILSKDFYRTMRIWRRYQTEIPRRGNLDQDEHRKILRAIEDREPDFAETLMRRHIRAIRQNYVEALRINDSTT